jgi:hypothetical protein
MAKKRKTKSKKSRRTSAKRRKPATKRRTKRSGIAQRISDVFDTLAGAAQDTDRLRRKMRRQGMDEG